MLAACGADVTGPTPAPSAFAPFGTSAQTEIHSTATAAGTSRSPSTPRWRSVPAISFPDPPERNLYEIAAALIPIVEPINPVVNVKPVTYQQGRLDTFWLVDVIGMEKYQSVFELRLVTPHAYWYVEEGQNVSQTDLEQAAVEFENTVYPRVSGVFGTEWIPGVDNDPHLNILNADLKGVGGYFSSGDEYPVSIKPNSNQREVIYLNTAAIPVSSRTYIQVLAHELQHAIHWNADKSEESWVNEGLAELAVAISGLESGSIRRFLHSGPTSLTNWPLSSLASTGAYGSASLFMHYLTEHYGGREDLRALLREPADGIAGIDAFLRNNGFAVGFKDVFRDWAVANVLDEEQGIYGYAGIDVQISRFEDLNPGDEFESEIPQYATEYVELRSLDGPVRVSFRGPTEATLLPVDVGSGGCWWSNSGDSIDSTLFRQVDLTIATAATINYQVWFDLEESWDYAYLEVSTDGSLTWSIIAGSHTFSANPIGNAYGPGYTGKSSGWLQESVDLGEYLGDEVWLRFQYITDDAVNGPGLCVRDLRLDVEGAPADAHEWASSGFIYIDNRVPQDYIVQLIQSGDRNAVLQVELDSRNSGQITIERPQEFDRVILAVQPLAPRTREPASYSVTLEPIY